MTRKVLSIFIFVLCVAGVATISAQTRYRNVYSRTDVDNFVKNLEASSDLFARDFKSAGATNSSERRTVDRFEAAVDRLRSRFNNTNTWWQSRNEVQNMMTSAQQVNIMMRNEAYARQLERQWRGLRRDINKLADTYELTELQGGNQGGGGGGGWIPPGGGGQTSTPPNWAQGTFYSTTGERILMRIESNGSITLENQGQVYTGRYYRGQMYLNNDVSTVSRSGNGISTYNQSSGQTTYYTREGSGGGGDGGIEGPTSRPPTWAVGTFYATNGSGIQMTIGDDGRITLFSAGQSYYGRYYNGQMFLNNDVSTVSRVRPNGIRTYNQSAGVTTDYRRQ